MHLLFLALLACAGTEPPTSTPGSAPASVEGRTPVSSPTGLTHFVLQEGSGEVAAAGDTVEMQYTGWLTDGTKFDSSLDHGGKPFSFNLGAGEVIKGWDEGVAGMKVGEKRQLRIPSKLGYGARGTPGGPIPPDADLVFDVELLKINGKA
jgi:FKBP-type peptidyl-prolyl cis-trans isomerase